MTITPFNSIGTANMFKNIIPNWGALQADEPNMTENPLPARGKEESKRRWRVSPFS
jgi:hypothetical protein